MQEQRKNERLKEYNEITITVISEEKNISRDNLFYNYSEDLSVSGTKIRGNILLPVDTILKIDFTLKTLQKQITAIGRIKWIKIIIEDKFYEAGVEFVDNPHEAIKKLEEYITWKKKIISNNPFGMPFWISAKFNEPQSE